MTQAEIRAAHPDWTDEQVKAELDRQQATPPAPTPPAPSPATDEKPDDAAFARMRRQAEEAERRAKQAEDALAERTRKEAEENDRWKQIAEEEKTAREKLEADNKAREVQRRAEQAATSLKFKDAGYALYLLQSDGVDLSDEAKVKEALDKYAESKPDLIAGTTLPGPSGGPAGGSNSDLPKVTREDISKMTPAQIQALDPKVLSEALAA